MKKLSKHITESFNQIDESKIFVNEKSDDLGDCYEVHGRFMLNNSDARNYTLVH